MDVQRISLSVYRERALLIGVAPGGDASVSESMAELRRLADTAGAVTVGQVVQRRRRPDPGSYVGAGKIHEIRDQAVERKADVIIVDGDLSPGQVRNLEESLDRKVVDRTEVILHIFALHARTRAARLQVELAQLEYTLPRLKRMWTHLSRYEGGIGMRGPGERQIETDRRLVSRRIVELRRRLEEISDRKVRQVRSRSGEVTVSLVGYTNAGKSTLLNTLTGANVRVDDSLFVTLDTRTRQWPLSDQRKVLLSDTIGFVSKLPHHLVASFHATLAEARTADLLIHVADVSSPATKRQIESVNSVLDELRCNEHPVILAFNKMDALEEEADIPLLRKAYPQAVFISARTGRGLDALDARMREFLDARSLHLQVRMTPSNGRLQAFLSEHGEVLDRAYEDTTVCFEVRIGVRYLGVLRRLGGEALTVDGMPLAR